MKKKTVKIINKTDRSLAASILGSGCSEKKRKAISQNAKKGGAPKKFSKTLDYRKK
jgi:hypothetical protein